MSHHRFKQCPEDRHEILGLSNDEIAKLIIKYAEYIGPLYGIQPELAKPLAYVVYKMWYLLCQPPPSITSAYRSPERQRELRALWDSGRRAGLAARPALNSAHTKGLAIDVSMKEPNFDTFKKLMIEETYVLWGGDFGDPVHFYVKK